MTAPSFWHELTGAQRAIWLDAALIGQSGAYRVTSRVECAGPLVEGYAKAATQALIEAHEALRIEIDAEQPRQRLCAEARDNFHFTRLADADALCLHMDDRARQGFTLGEGQALHRVEVIEAGGVWQVLIEAHHLVADGIAMARLRHDWIAAYNALAEGRIPHLEHSEFLSAVARDAQFLASPDAAAAQAHWRERLADLQPPLFEGALPAPDAQSLGSPSFTLEPERYAALAQAARAAGTTAHRALVVLVGMALARRYGRDQSLVGMALHGRDTGQLVCVGQFARVLPLLCAIDQSASLSENLRANAALLDADMAHQRLPLDAITRACGVAGAERRHLVEVAISILPYSPNGEPDLAGRPITLARAPNVEHSPLSVYMRESADGELVVTLGHDPALVTAPEAWRISDRLQAAFDRLIDKPQAKLSSLARLAKGEEVQIERMGQGPRLKLASALPLDLLAGHVQANPQALAIHDGERALSYAQMDAQSRQLAAALAARGLAKGDVVAVILDRSAETILALVAILRLGAVYLPIDPVQPIARAQGMLHQAKAKLVIARPDWAEALGEEFACIAADERGEAIMPDVPVDPADPAYIIFTSGSTGAPKGVVVPHRALANLDAARQHHDPIGAGDHILAAISVGFDVSLGQLLLPLLRGASVVIAPDLRLMSPSQFWAFLAHYNVTHINSVPSFFEAMLEAAPADARLKRLMLGGEPLTGMLARRLRKGLNDTPVVNMYGPTEACIDASAYPVPADLDEGVVALPIGAPLPNYSFHILDSRQMPVGIGQAGELYIGGQGLARGYLDTPDLTAQRFLQADYGRLYRTGDLAAWREDGVVMFLGRADGQVKIRGHRIELGEIEARLVGHEAVAQAAVIARKDASGALRLLAYVVPGEGKEPDPAALLTYIGEGLPHYMVPAALMALPTLPLTTNGKLDTRALPDPAATPSRAPQGEMENAMAALFATLFGVDTIGAEDSFFELGGHSLLATQLVVRLRETLGVSLPVRAIYEAPSVAALARRVEQAEVASARPPITPRAIERTAIPLSFAQERLWFLEKLQPGTATYTIPLVFRLTGELDPARLEAALGVLVMRHEALRTGFAEGEAQRPHLVIAPEAALPVTLRDMTGSDETTMRRAIADQILLPFDLARAPLIRLALFRLGEAEHIAVLCVHHIIADGWSVAVLLDELALLYNAPGTLLPALEITPADAAIWQREILDGPELALQQAWWEQHLADAPDLLALPPDLDAAHDDALVTVAINAETGARVQALSTRMRVSPFAVLMAGWGLLLGRFAGQRELLTGTVLAGRQDARLEPLVGHFVATFPVRIGIRETIAEMIRETHEQLLDIHAHQDVPLERLVQAMKPQRLAGRHPLFQTLFVLQNGPAPSPDFAGLAVTPLPVDAAPARFDLALSLSPLPQGGYGGDISFSGKLFTPDTVVALARRFEALVAALATSPDALVESLPPLCDWGQDWQDAPPPRAATKQDGAEASPEIASMCALWSEVLGLGIVAPDDNFFAIGGHSLAALRLMTRIEAERGLPLPVSLLFAHQTPACLCAALTGQELDANGPLVEIQAGDGQEEAPVLVCVHPVGGGVFGYAGLAQALSPKGRVLGLQASEHESDNPAPASAEALAANYLVALRAANIAGPIHLLGHSFGGLIAFFMAQQLEAEGQPPASLILLDTEFPQGRPTSPPAAFMATIPPHRRALVEHHVALANACKPAGRVRSLAYIRADGDLRDSARETLWLALADDAIALPAMPCGHYAMLEHRAALASRISGVVNFNLGDLPDKRHS